MLKIISFHQCAKKLKLVLLMFKISELDSKEIQISQCITIATNKFTYMYNNTKHKKHSTSTTSSNNFIALHFYTIQWVDMKQYLPAQLWTWNTWLTNPRPGRNVKHINRNGDLQPSSITIKQKCHFFKRFFFQWETAYF